MSELGIGDGLGLEHRVRVRRIDTVGEVSGLRALVSDHVQFEGSQAPVPENWEKEIDGHLRAGSLRLFVAEQGGQAVGYASLTDELATWTGRVRAHLDCLYLHQAHRSRGLGRRLVSAAIEDARRRGRVEVQWQTPAWNQSAIAFYERLGAERTAKERFTLRLLPGTASVGKE